MYLGLDAAMAKQLRDLKYESLVQWAVSATAEGANPVQAKISGDYKLIAEVGTRFINNVRNWLLLAQMPSGLSVQASASQAAIDLATLQMTGKLNHQLGQKVEDEILTESTRIMPSMIKSVNKGNIAAMAGARFVDNICRDNEQANSAIEVFLLSLAVSAWANFEAMAGDLWEAALNTHPRILSDLKGKRAKQQSEPKGDSRDREIDGDLEDAEADEGDDGKKVSFNRRLLQKYNFDLAHRMGTLLRGTYKFTKLDQTRLAYKSAFSRDYKGIDTAINDSSLDALSAARHVIVHKAGKADEEYQQAAKWLHQLPSHEFDQQLVLDGDQVVSLVNPVMRRGADLISEVDAWIVMNNKSTNRRAKK